MISNFATVICLGFLGFKLQVERFSVASCYLQGVPKKGLIFGVFFGTPCILYYLCMCFKDWNAQCLSWLLQCLCLTHIIPRRWYYCVRCWCWDEANDVYCCSDVAVAEELSCESLRLEIWWWCCSVIHNSVEWSSSCSALLCWYSSMPGYNILPGLSH